MASSTVNPGSTNALPSSSPRRRKPADPNRCSHRDAHGNRCQVSILDPGSRLCFRHLGERLNQPDSVDLAAELIGELTALSTLEDINDFVFQVIRLLAQGRISTRRAAVLIYGGNLALRTAIENKRQFDQRVPVVRFDLPGPDYAEPDTNPSPTPVPDYTNRS